MRSVIGCMRLRSCSAKSECAMESRLGYILRNEVTMRLAAFKGPGLALGFIPLIAGGAMRDGFITWGADPNAFAAEAWGEAVAWKQ